MANTKPIKPSAEPTVPDEINPVKLKRTTYKYKPGTPQWEKQQALKKKRSAARAKANKEEGKARQLEKEAEFDRLREDGYFHDANGEVIKDPRNKHKKAWDEKAIAKEYTELSYKVVAGIMLNEDGKASDRLAAAKLMIERGWGKAKETVEITQNASDTFLDALRRIADIKKNEALLPPPTDKPMEIIQATEAEYVEVIKKEDNG